jgi:hypothetical protein
MAKKSTFKPTNFEEEGFDWIEINNPTKVCKKGEKCYFRLRRLPKKIEPPKSRKTLNEILSIRSESITSQHAVGREIRFGIYDKRGKLMPIWSYNNDNEIKIDKENIKQENGKYYQKMNFGKERR